MSTRSNGPYSFEGSNEDKLFFPKAGITKGALIDYYEKIAATMLPYLEERPVAMQRLPDGIDSEGFFQKEAPGYFPDWVEREMVAKEDGQICHVIINNAATLAYLADQGSITPHVWLSRRDKLNHPDRLIVDLDPANNDFSSVRQAAQKARELFEILELPVYVMTTGSRGLHLLVPLDRSQDFEQVRAFARTLTAELVERDPKQLTTEMRKKNRGDRIYLDIARNAYGQHGVAPYAVRPRPGAPVATPLSWEEVGAVSLAPDKYTIRSIFRRLGQKEDPWLNMQKKPSASQQHLKNLLGTIERLRKSNVLPGKHLQISKI